MPAKSSFSHPSASAQLKGFIARYDPTDRRLIRAVRGAVRKRFPTAHELVYDNYLFFVIGYSPTERPSDAIISIAARAGSVALCFLQGAKLPDPKHMMRGAGSQARSIGLPTASVLTDPDVEALLVAAVARARVPLAATGRGKLVIRSIFAKQRPRR